MTSISLRDFPKQTTSPHSENITPLSPSSYLPAEDQKEVPSQLVEDTHPYASEAINGLTVSAVDSDKGVSPLVTNASKYGDAENFSDLGMLAQPVVCWPIA